MNEQGENQPPQYERDDTAFVVKLINLGSSRFSLDHPLSVLVEQANGQFIVTEIETRSYSNQNDLDTAMEDLRDIMVNRREILGTPGLLAPGADYIAEQWQELMIDRPADPQE